MPVTMVRTPVDSELWKRFRLLALQRDVSATALLLKLIEREVDESEQ